MEEDDPQLLRARKELQEHLQHIGIEEEMHKKKLVAGIRL